jgi:hypothetical protein
MPDLILFQSRTASQSVSAQISSKFEDSVIGETNKKSQPQTVLSMIILSILMVIGVGVFLTQFQYNPAVLHKDALLPEPEKDKPSSKWAPDASLVPLPEGVQPLGATEIFNARNLSDKINGKAELYLSAGFTRLVSQRFEDNRTTDLWMEVFVYDMGNSQNAFSVFSAQRRKDADPLNLTRYAYRTSNAIFLIHGRYYVEIIASKGSEHALKPVKTMAETFIRNTPAEAATVDETKLFPEAKMVKDSIVLISSDAFGFDGYKKIYTAEYEFDDHRLMAYLSHRSSPKEAKELALNYAKFLLAFGGQDIEAELSIKDARLIKIMDTYEIVFSHDSYLAGVREAATIDRAKLSAVQLYNRLHEVGNESRSKQ